MDIKKTCKFKQLCKEVLTNAGRYKGSECCHSKVPSKNCLAVFLILIAITIVDFLNTRTPDHVSAAIVYISSFILLTIDHHAGSMSLFCELSIRPHVNAGSLMNV